MLKAITLYEPWASLMAIGAKQNETRGHRTLHRGDICIHAAKISPGVSDEVLRAELRAYSDRDFGQRASAGCIVAMVDLFEVRRTEDFGFEGTDPLLIQISEEEQGFGNYGAGRFVYRTRNLRRLRSTVPCRGFQCVGWTVPDEIEQRVREQL